MASFSNGFGDFRPLAGPGPKSGPKLLVSVLVLKIFGPWLAQDQQVVQMVSFSTGFEDFWPWLAQAKKVVPNG